MSVQPELPQGNVRGIRVPRAIHPSRAQYSNRLVGVDLPAGLPEPEEIYTELNGYCDVLLGRVPPPLDSPYLTLAEVAVAYYSRALELDMLIHQAEDQNQVRRGSPYYRIRTGVLRSFIDMSKRLYDLGSRRLSQEDLISRQRRDMGESY